MNRPLAAALILSVSFASAAAAADPPAAAKDDGEWIVLFDGRGLDGWQDSRGGATKWKVEDGTMVGQDGSGDIWTKERYGDFVLEVEFKTTGNSGVFFRTDDPKDNVQTGIEVQVDNPGGPNRNSVGALYDLVAPSKNAAKKDDWNQYRITCKGPNIAVELNGEKIAEMDVDRWTEAGKNPDGSPNKYRKAVRDFSREGHIGFQDHGHSVRYRNVRIRPLK